MKHSKARNIVKCTFGILKMRWEMMCDTSWYSPRMVGLFFTTCCLLHNFICSGGGPDVFEKAYVPPSTNDAEYIETIYTMPLRTLRLQKGGLNSGIPSLNKCGQQGDTRRVPYHFENFLCSDLYLSSNVSVCLRHFVVCRLWLFAFA
ncbi:hypothetical protein LINPERPRIM_LOCUS21979 [Linum perenne]